MDIIKGKQADIPHLTNAPLVETIFELRWEIQEDRQAGRMKDPSYPMMYGGIYERLKKDFPIVEDLPTTQVHPEVNPYLVRHRIRKEKDGYPLIQVGPGIITVNFAKGYSWYGFKNLILRVVGLIADLYPQDVFPLNFIKSELRYVNGIRLDTERDENPLAFLAEKLHTKIELASDFFGSSEMDDKPLAVGLNLVYPLNKPVGSVQLSTQLGQMNGNPAYLVQTGIQSFGETTPHDAKAFEIWLYQAHTVAKNCFLSLSKGALLEEFCGS